MSQINATVPVATPHVTVFSQRDASGHIVGATAKGTDGLMVGVQFPPFPDQNSITFTKAGAPDLVMTQSLAQNTCTLTATVGSERLTFEFTSNGPFSVPHYLIIGGGACPDAQTLWGDLNKVFDRFFVVSFDDHFGFDFQQFLSLCKQAALERSPDGTNPDLTFVLPGGGPGGAANKSKAGVIGRALVWGIAGAAVAAATGGGGLVILASFIWGADASAMSDLVTAVDNSSDDGGGAHPSVSTPQGTNDQGTVKKDEPVVPPQKK